MPHDESKHLQNRMKPAPMDHLAEQIIARSKTIEQEQKSSAFKFPHFWKKPQFSYALVAVCCVIVLAVAVQHNVNVTAPNTVEVAQNEREAQDWEEFLLLEDEQLFAGLY